MVEKKCLLTRKCAKLQSQASPSSQCDLKQNCSGEFENNLPFRLVMQTDSRPGFEIGLDLGFEVEIVIDV